MNKTKQAIQRAAASSNKKSAAVITHRSFRLSKSAAKSPQGRSNIGFFLAVGVLFLIAGGLIGYQPFMRYWEGHGKPTAPAPAPARTAAVEAATQTNRVIAGKPTRIVIPSLGIDIQITDGIYYTKSQTWTLTNDKAQYAVMTSQPNNQSGNTFIYGHNRPQVFSRLSKLGVGQIVQVYTTGNHVFTYRYRSYYETNPNDDTLFTYQGPPILTLQTCSGIWYQNRYLMTLDLVGVA
jgi:LPXTG-site transpeptidase (sortase) family protein